MKVELLYHTPDPERAIAAAARLCYAKEGASTLMEEMGEDRENSVLKTILSREHFSALEHASFTFAVEGVSRALTHQLVRHRVASYNQQSQRYVKFSDGLDVVVPPKVSEKPECEQLFNETTKIIMDAYQKLLAAGIPPEDARYLLPNAAQTKIVITMNARELLHYFELRCHRTAQWEIRDMSNAMLDLVRPIAPRVFAVLDAK